VDRLDVLHVQDSLERGGAEQNLLSLLRNLPRERFRHHVAWLYRADPQFQKELSAVVDSFIAVDASGRVGIPTAAVRLAGWIRAHRPHVIHAQLVRAQIVARAAAFATRTPVVTTWQNTPYHDAALSEFGGSRLTRFVVRLADAASGWIDRRHVAVSQFVADECSRTLWADPNKVTVIYNAVDPSRYQPLDSSELERTRALLGIERDAPVILTVGRLVPQKSQSDLLDAMALVVEKVPAATLLVAGTGPLDAPLRDQARRLQIDHAVRFLGARRDVAALYQLASLFAFPSRYEGLSVALVEALSNGLPAVVSDIPQNREVADGLPSVRMVRCGDSQALAAALIDTISHLDEHRTIARQHRLAIADRFSPQLLSRRFGAVLEDAAMRG
jgi:glycosyltransferase involved in cell wall biosynthesis